MTTLRKLATHALNIGAVLLLALAAALLIWVFGVLCGELGVCVG